MFLSHPTAAPDQFRVAKHGGDERSCNYFESRENISFLDIKIRPDLKYVANKIRSNGPAPEREARSHLLLTQ